MKALSLWQPWASLVACGVKTIETRSWAPPQETIGQRIAIHATKVGPSFMEPIFRHEAEAALGTSIRDLPRGAVLCTAMLTGASQVEQVYLTTDGYNIVETSTGRYNADNWGDFAVGRWLWFLSDVRTLKKPQNARGRQRLWGWTREVDTNGN